MRNNMTASMFDLSMKEKPRSPFSKLKDKMKGRKHDSGFGDTSSAILPRSAACDLEPSHQSLGPDRQTKPEAKVKRQLLAGGQKLSAAHSMSDLIGSHSRPKQDSISSMEESGEDQSFSILYLVTPVCFTIAVFRHDLQVKSKELTTEFTQSLPFTHSQQTNPPLLTLLWFSHRHRWSGLITSNSIHRCLLHVCHSKIFVFCFFHFCVRRVLKASSTPPTR